MDLTELQLPPSPLELAQLVTAATAPDMQLNAAGVAILRRLMFDYERRLSPPPAAPAGVPDDVRERIVAAIHRASNSIHDSQDWDDDYHRDLDAKGRTIMERLVDDILAALGLPAP